VVNLARRAGLGKNIEPTPAVALGAYEATPIEMAGAYTIFANQGSYVAPRLVSRVCARDGRVLYKGKAESWSALDPRVAYMMVSLLQEVMRSGTAAGVRSRGFNLPAAGKTGTSRDGWFAGFTSRLLCVVWVGFDDNRELGLEGARSALPIWTEFMKRASQFREYRDAKQFAPVPGIVTVEICPESGLVAGPECPEPRIEVFIAGTQPSQECQIHSGINALDDIDSSVSSGR
jgi:penicillin-binding protein 1B